MASTALSFTLSYEGAASDRHLIDFYDVSQALVGFQRSLALTTHLILNGTVITQAPSLKGARLLALPSEEGSWKWTTIVVLTGTALFELGTAPKDTPIGNLVYSAYDYVISESLGFHVDYNKTLLQQYETVKASHPEAKTLPESKFESLVEKCETAVRYLHRPIVESESATTATISASIYGTENSVGDTLSSETFDYLQYTIRSDRPLEFDGKISSYNINTYKGRVYVTDSQRPIPFVLPDFLRTKRNVGLITRSLDLNANSGGQDGGIQFAAYTFTSRTGRLKWLLLNRLGPDQ